MRRPRTKLIVTAVAGLLFVALLIYLQFDDDRVVEGWDSDEIEEIIQATEPSTEQRAPRAISPEQFAQPFAENAVRLERIAPRQPLTPPKPTGPKLTLLHQPVATAAGLIQFREGLLQLADIEVLDAQSVCFDTAGEVWPCGLIGRTAFRNYLRGRALSCVVPESRWSDTVVTRCMLGAEDPAAWLVSRGWVRAAPGSDYAALEQTARDTGKGIYGADPRGPTSVSDSGVDIAPLTDTPVTPPPDSQPEPGQ